MWGCSQYSIAERQDYCLVLIIGYCPIVMTKNCQSLGKLFILSSMKHECSWSYGTLFSFVNSTSLHHFIYRIHVYKKNTELGYMIIFRNITQYTFNPWTWPMTMTRQSPRSHHLQHSFTVQYFMLSTLDCSIEEQSCFLLAAIVYGLLRLCVSDLWWQDTFGIQPHTVGWHACHSQRHLNEGPATKMPRSFPNGMTAGEIRGETAKV